MPDVGVLELTIQDNAQGAAKGVNQLAGAISSLKTNIGNGIGLGVVSTQVTALAKKINEATGTSTVMRNLSSFFNAVSNFSKIKKFEIDTTPFEKIKTAISGGINIGKAGTELNKMREAFGGEWDSTGASSSIENLIPVVNSLDENGTVDKLKDLTAALKGYSSAVLSIPKSSKKNMEGAVNIGDIGTQIRTFNEAIAGSTGAETFISNMAGIREEATAMGKANTATKIQTVADAILNYGKALSKVPDAAGKIGDIVGDTKNKGGKGKAMKLDLQKHAGGPIDPTEEIKQAVEKSKGLMKLDLQQFGRRKQVPGQVAMDLDNLAKPANDFLDTVTEKVQTATEGTKEFQKALEQAKEVASSTGSAQIKDSVADSVQNNILPALDSPLDALRNRFANVGADGIGRSIDIVIPKINKLGVQAQITSKHIEAIINRLNSEIKYKGLDEVANQIAGVRKNFLSAKDSAKIFDAAPIAQFNVVLRETGDLLESVLVPKAGNPFNFVPRLTGDVWKPDFVMLDEETSKAQLRFQELGSYLEKLKDDIAFIRTPSGTSSASMYADMVNQMWQARTEAESFHGAIDRTNAIVQNMSFRFAEMYETFKKMMNDMMYAKSAFALGSGVGGYLESGYQRINQQETGWTYWKNGAIEVEGTVNDAEDSILKLENTARIGLPSGNILDEIKDKANAANEALETVDSRIGKANEALGVSDSRIERANAIRKEQEERFYASNVKGLEETNAMADQLTQLDLLKAQLREAEIKYNEFVNTLGATDAKTIKAGLAVSDLRDKIWKFKEDIQQASESKIENTIGSEPLSLEQTNAMAGNLTQLDLLQAQLHEAQNTYNNFMNTLGATDAKTIKAGLAVSELTEKIREFVETHKEMNFLQALGSSFGDFGNGIEKLFPGLTGLLKRFKSLVKYRMLRSIIRGITQGFSEGVKNVYQYSKAVGTSFAPAMDEATAVMKQFKNSIGAAAAPLIQAFVPVLHQVVNVVITVINYLNQMFALLNGQTSWTSAIYNASDAFDDAASSAGGAGKAVKDLLADWDELNIIQSESGGGGGGGGKKQEDYASMFEQVNEFEETVKRIFDFINEHMGGLSSVLKKLGALILGWKFSKAFKGVLGQLGKLVAGGALIAIGIDLSYGSGFEAGRKGYFDGLDLLGAIGGTLATAIGGYIITSTFGFGGTVGLVIGLGVGIALVFKGYYDGMRDAIDEAKWGDVHKTSEEIAAEVRKQFSFDVDASIEVMNAYIKDEKDARKKVDDAVATFNASLEEAKIIVNTDATDAETKVQAVKKAAEDAQAAIIALQNLIDTNENGLKYTMTNFTFVNEQGEDITDSLLNSITTSDGTLRDYFIGIGEELAGLILEGERNKWQGDEMLQAIELMESQKRIQEYASQMENELKFQTSVKAGLSGVVDRDTAMATIEEQKALLEEYKETSKAMLLAQADTQTYLASLAYGAIQVEMEKENPDLELIEKLQAVYDEKVAAATALKEKVKNGQFEDELAESIKTMREGWTDVLGKVYGGDADTEGIFESLFADKGSLLEFFDDLFGAGHSSDDMIMRAIDELGIEGAADKYLNMLLESFYAQDGSGAVQWYVEGLGGNIYDLLSDEIKKYTAEKLLEDIESPVSAYDFFKAMFKIDDAEAQKYINLDDFQYQDVWRQQIQKAQEDAKEAVEDAEPVQAQLPVEVQPEYTINNDSDWGKEIINDINKSIEDGVYSSDEAIDLLIKYGAELYNKAFESLEYNLDDAGNLIDKNGNLIASAIEEELQEAVESMDPVETSVKLHVDPEIELSNNAKYYLQMIENAVNSGKGMGEITAANKQALDMFGLDAFLEAKPYVQELIQMYKELNEIQDGANVGGKLATTDGILGNVLNSGTNAGGGNEKVTVDDENIANGVSKGMEENTTAVSSRLDITNSLLQRLLLKEFSAVLKPTSAVGLGLLAGLNAANNVNGGV